MSKGTFENGEWQGAPSCVMPCMYHKHLPSIGHAVQEPRAPPNHKSRPTSSRCSQHAPRMGTQQALCGSLCIKIRGCIVRSQALDIRGSGDWARFVFVFSCWSFWKGSTRQSPPNPQGRRGSDLPKVTKKVGGQARIQTQPWFPTLYHCGASQHPGGVSMLLTPISQVRGRGAERQSHRGLVRSGRKRQRWDVNPGLPLQSLWFQTPGVHDSEGIRDKWLGWGKYTKTSILIFNLKMK